MKSQTTLIILPHAGGGAHQYSALARSFPPGIAVHCMEYSGHGRRVREPLLHNMEDVIDDMLACIRPMIREPWCMLGHSMGAMVAYGVADRCRRAGLPMPLRLFLSGTTWPADRTWTAMSHLDSAAFFARVQEYGGMDEQILAHPELLEFVEPILKADFKAVEEYDPEPLPLDLPCSILYGTDDMTEQQARTWKVGSRYPVELHPFSGDHFYILDQIRPVVASVCDCI